MNEQSKSAMSLRCASIARAVATQNPEALLPCPECAAEVKSANLDKHLTKVHSIDAATSPSGMQVLVGADHGMQIWTYLPPVILFAVLYPAMVAAEDDFQPVLAVWVLLFVLAGAAWVAALMGKFRASVEVDESGITLRSVLGLSRRHVSWPVRIETGSLMERKEDNMVKDGYGYRGPATAVQVGSYLALHGANQKKVVLGSKKSTHPLKYWDMDHIQGKARRMWDVQFQPVELVRLQYLLAERGTIVPKAT